jgi:hypothetical protein
MWIKAAVGFGIAAVLAIGGWQLAHVIGDHFKTHEQNKVRITELEGEIKQVRDDLAAERLARKLDAQDSLDGYQKADWACQQTVKQAVAGTRVIKVPIEEIIYVDREISTPRECPTIKLPDFFRMSDIQRAGTDPD